MCIRDRTRADLKDKTVGLQKGSSSYNALTSDPISKEVKEIKEYVNNVDAYNDLKAGRIDVYKRQRLRLQLPADLPMPARFWTKLNPVRRIINLSKLCAAPAAV